MRTCFVSSAAEPGLCSGAISVVASTHLPIKASTGVVTGTSD